MMCTYKGPICFSLPCDVCHMLEQHLKDKFWNFIFYKFIFIFGVLNVQRVDEVVLWCLWFSMLIFLHLMVQLCKDRFEYVSKLNIHHINGMESLWHYL